MNNVWLVSDTHFGHANACVFRNSDGTKMRPWDDVNEMDEVMVDNWNRVVKPGDRVYHLGDVAINRRYVSVCVEQTNFTPINLDAVVDILNARRVELGDTGVVGTFH